MNLSQPTNSLQSNIMHASVKGAPVPTVGMGVTILCWTDRYVGTINKVINEKEFHFTIDETVADKSKDCSMGHQNWIHTPQPDGAKRIAMMGRDGRWYEARKTKTGRMSVSKKCQPLAVGFKNYNYDWSF